MEKMTLTANSVQRYKWIDWMKVYGIYFIVLGHFFPYAYEFIYVFSVPVFFCVSGFLTKKEKDYKLFLQKTFYNLHYSNAAIMLNKFRV